MQVKHVLMAASYCVTCHSMIATRLLMICSAFFMGTIGLILTFFPQETLVYLCIPFQVILPFMLQLLGAIYLAFSLLNWTAKDKLVGGIYSRPVTLGNLFHFVLGAATILKGAIYVKHIPMLFVLGAIYGVFALAYTLVLITSPVKAR